MRLFLLSLLLVNTLYAVTPFSLEGLREVNVLIIDKGKALQKETILKIKKATLKKLGSIGLKTKTDKFSNFIIKIDVNSVENQFAVLVSLWMIESVNPIRNKELENVAITYQKNDFFIEDNLD